jgi:hypothetical protein
MNVVALDTVVYVYTGWPIMTALLMMMAHIMFSFISA